MRRVIRSKRVLGAGILLPLLAVIAITGMARPGVSPTAQTASTPWSAPHDPAQAGWRPLTRTEAERLLAGPVDTVHGQRVRLPENRPVLFMAWWCPYCHKTLTTLRLSPVLSHLSVVSIWVTAGHVEPPIRNAADAARVTEAALHRIGVHIPLSHLYLAMPSSPVNREIQGIPMVMTPYRGVWYQAAGAPQKTSDWTPYL